MGSPDPSLSLEFVRTPLACPAPDTQAPVGPLRGVSAALTAELRTDAPTRTAFLDICPARPPAPLETSAQQGPLGLSPFCLDLPPYHLSPSNPFDSLSAWFVYCLSHPTGMEVNEGFLCGF